MKWNLFDRWLLVVAICLSVGSCQQLPDELCTDTEKGTLKVKTRSADKGEVVYPLTLYVFSSDGDCVDTQLIEDEEEDVQLHLAEGQYRIVAVSACRDGYLASTITDWEDVIEIPEDGGADIPLMMGKSDVTVGSTTKGKLEIVLSYSVTAMDVALSNIPSDVTEVVVTLSPFYTAVNLKGEYIGSDYSLNLPCSQDAEGRWSTKTRYLFPGSGKETVLSIWMKKQDGEEMTYGYTWKDTPEANQPYHLQGSYNGLVLNGAFIMKAWNEAEEVEFEFGETTSSDEKDETEGGDDSGTDLLGSPKVGEIWNGSIVANMIEKDGSEVELLLLSLDQWYGYSSMVPEVISGYSVNGIAEWRLPTREEVEFLMKSYSGDNRLALNQRIDEYDEEGLAGINGDGRYLFEDAGGYFTFVFNSGRKIWEAGEKTKYYIRLVKSYRFMN